MACNLSVREVRGVPIMDVSGRIVLGDGSKVIREAVKGLLDKGQKHILLNMEEVSYVDSAGLGELVSSYTSVKNQGGQLILLNLSKGVMDLMAITKLATIFEVFENEGVAVLHLWPKVNAA